MIRQANRHHSISQRSARRFPQRASMRLSLPWRDAVKMNFSAAAVQWPLCALLSRGAARFSRSQDWRPPRRSCSSCARRPLRARLQQPNPQRQEVLPKHSAFLPHTQNQSKDAPRVRQQEGRRNNDERDSHTRPDGMAGDTAAGGSVWHRRCGRRGDRSLTHGGSAACRARTAGTPRSVAAVSRAYGPHAGAACEDQNDPRRAAAEGRHGDEYGSAAIAGAERFHFCADSRSTDARTADAVRSRPAASRSRAWNARSGWPRRSRRWRWSAARATPATSKRWARPAAAAGRSWSAT